LLRDDWNDSDNRWNIGHRFFWEHYLVLGEGEATWTEAVSMGDVYRHHYRLGVALFSPVAHNRNSERKICRSRSPGSVDHWLYFVLRWPLKATAFRRDGILHYVRFDISDPRARRWILW
jgi:hypothetical protein